jgi:hypothetical protein
MNLKNNSIWLWASLVLLSIIILLIVRDKKSPEQPPRFDVEVAESPVDSTHHLYYQFIEAVNLKASGNEKSALKILKILSESENTDIRKAAIYELGKPKVNQVTETSPLNLQPEIKDLGEVELPEPKQNLKEIEFNSANVEKLRNTEPFLNLISSKGKQFEYLGDIENQKANGYGIGIYESGSIYKGYWKDNQRHGKGIFTWKDGERYDGHYAADLRHGEGTYIWKNGEKYTGEWKEDQRHGKGTIFKKNGKIKNSGVWEADKLIKSVKE